MSKESYIRGFCKAAEARGVDPKALAKFALDATQESEALSEIGKDFRRSPFYWDDVGQRRANVLNVGSLPKDTLKGYYTTGNGGVPVLTEAGTNAANTVFHALSNQKSNSATVPTHSAKLAKRTVGPMLKGYNEPLSWWHRILDRIPFGIGSDFTTRKLSPDYDWFAREAADAVDRREKREQKK